MTGICRTVQSSLYGCSAFSIRIAFRGSIPLAISEEKSTNCFRRTVSSMITTVIIAVTAIVSILCFNSPTLFRTLTFSPWEVMHRKKWYTLFSHALVHGGWGHLFFNMLTLYFFGSVVENYFGAAFGSPSGGILYIVLYVTAAAASSIWAARTGTGACTP